MGTKEMTNKIFCGDCRKILKEIDTCSIPLTITSPPYDQLREYSGGSGKAWNFEVFKPIAQQIFRVTKQGGIVVWVVGDATVNGSETGTSFRQALYFMECGFNLHDTMIYEKANISFPESNRYYNAFEYMFVFSKGKPKTFNPIKTKNPLGGKPVTSTKRGKNGIVIKDHGYVTKKLRPDYSVIRNVWIIQNGHCGVGQKHPAIFPEKLANDHIISWSNKGDLVLDCFAGSGTTCKMAIENHRNYIGIEISEEYIPIINQRITQAQPSLF